MKYDASVKGKLRIIPPHCAVGQYACRYVLREQGTYLLGLLHPGLLCRFHCSSFGLSPTLSGANSENKYHRLFTFNILPEVRLLSILAPSRSYTPGRLRIPINSLRHHPAGRTARRTPGSSRHYYYYSKEGGDLSLR